MSDFVKSIDRALADPVLSSSLTRFSEAYRTGRARAFEGIDFEAVRTQIAERKSHAARNLDVLAERFTQQAQAAGAKVTRVSTPVDACQYVLAVANQSGARSIVKSKSMASEEIHLNATLEKAGIEVAETDLGEWIIQLAHERPSHMVLPAIHKTRGQVASLFSRQTNEELTDDIPGLVAVARRELRSRFLSADIGITGANIAVAETGSIVLLTNEGNARLVTTLPRTHIAIVGLEKLVERFDDIQPILTALPRSATGQLITSYVSIITGAAENTDGTPKDLHIVLLDNRRTEMAADPVFSEALQCIRCGSCLNVCPIFRLVGGHVFGKVYTGGIGAILTAWFDALEESRDIQSLCVQCGTCKDFCPANIDIPALIREVRDRVTHRDGLPFLQRAAYAVVNNRRLFHAALRAASIAQKPVAGGGFIRHLPFALTSMTEGRSLPAIASRPFRDDFPEIPQPECTETAIFYAGCLIDFVYPETGASVVKVLNHAGVRVVFPMEQTCCGAPARYGGSPEAAADAAKANIDALSAQSADYVVSACPTCTAALKIDFPELMDKFGTPDQQQSARIIAEKTRDFSSLVQQLASQGRLKFKQDSPGAGVTAYHDSCHLKRTLGVVNQPRELLSAAGYEISEMAESDTCCGMGGAYSIKMPAVARAVLDRKLTNIKATGAPELSTDCPGCVLQIRGGCDAAGIDVGVRHTADRIADRIAD
ncbi:MAG: LUD domain-containing protein [Bryobacteraceae bacterium]|nr:LUD domain-containing protein [Bryobacteraceae bacterium]